MPELEAIFKTRQAQTNLDNLVKGFRELAQEAARSGQVLQGSFGGNVKGIQDTAQATKQLGTESKGTFTVLGNLKKLIPTIATGAAIAGVLNYANAWNLAQRSIAVAVTDTSQIAGITGQLADIARGAGVNVQNVADAFQRYSIATKDLNLSQGETIDLVQTLTRGFSIFASSSAEAASASTQLAQAFAKGRLDGDELKSVLESFPPLGRALADVLGVTVGELRDLGAAGAITGDVLKQAIDELGDSLDGLEERAGRTLGQALSALGTSFSELVGNVDDAIGVSDLFIGAIDGTADAIASLSDAAFPTLAQRVEDARDEVAALSGEVDTGVVRLTAFDAITNRYIASSGELARAQGVLRDAIVDVTSAIAKGQLQTDQVVSGIGSYDEAVTDLSSSLGTVINDVEGFTVSARDQAAGIADAEFALGEYNAAARLTAQQVSALDQIFFEFEQQTDAINRQGRELAGTFQFLATTSRDAALAANEQEAALERLDGVFEEFEEETRSIDEAFRGLADSIGGFIGITGAQLETFFANANKLLAELGLNFGQTFRSIAQSIADAMGVSIEQVDGFFGLAAEGLDILGIEFEDVFGKKLTGIIERFAGLSQNEIGALGDIFGTVAGVIGGVFNPQVDSASNSFAALGITGNQSLGGISQQVEGLIDDLFGLNESIDGTSVSAGTLGASLGAVFTVGSIGFADLQDKIGGVNAALLGGLNPSILTTNGLFKIFGIDAVGAVQSVIGSLGGLTSAITNFGGIFSGVIGQASSVFKLFSGDIQGAFLQALGPIGSALDAFGVDFNSVISGAGNLFRNVFQGIQSAGTTVFNALASAGRALGGALQSVASGILGAFTGAFNAIRNVATSAFNFIAGAGRQLLGALSGVFSGIAGAAAGAFNSLVGVARGAFGAIAGAAQGLAGAIGNAIGGAVSRARSLIGSLGSSIGAAGRRAGAGIVNPTPAPSTGFKLRGRFAKGGVITGPTSLAGPGLGGKKFASGGILDFPTVLGNPANAVQTRNLGLAGEAGPEGILPLTETSQGLGVSATGVGGRNETTIIMIEGVDRDETNQLKRRLQRLDASIEFRSIAAVERRLVA